MRIDPDLGSALLQGAMVLLLVLSRSDPPLTASIAFIGVGSCAYLLLSAATLRYPERAPELRGILTTAGTLAAAGFVLRLSPDPMSAMLEWTLFTVSVVALFLSTGWAATLRWTAGAWWVAAGLSLIAVIALVPARGPDGTRAAAQLAHSAPVPVLALALTAVAAAGAVRWRSPYRLSLTVRAWVVALPPVAVYAFTRDPAALFVVGLPLFAVLVTHLTVLREGWSRLLAVSSAVVVGVVAAVAGLIAFRPGGAFHLTGPEPARDFLGALPGTTHAVAGGAAVALLLLLAAVLIGQVTMLFGAILRRPGTDRDEVLPFAAGVTVLLVVLLAGPIAAGAGCPVPAGLAVLPLASDGASFLIVLAGAGFLFGAGSQDSTAASQLLNGRMQPAAAPSGQYR